MYGVWGEDRDAGTVEFLERVDTREQAIAVAREHMTDWPIVSYEWESPYCDTEVWEIAVNGEIVPLFREE